MIEDEAIFLIIIKIKCIRCKKTKDFFIFVKTNH